MKTKTISNLGIFILNGIVTYFAILFMTFGFSGNTLYFLVFLTILSNVFYSFTPMNILKKYSIFNFLFKILLHGITTYLLMVIFAQLNKI